MNIYKQFIIWLEKKPIREGIFYIAMTLIAISMWI